mgnify:CR=1 FL=1
MEKDKKKKTLTISSSLKKKIDTASITRDGKKSFSVEKKKQFKPKSFGKMLRRGLISGGQEVQISIKVD